MAMIVIDETYCKGCGYCVHFCPKDCLEMTDRFNVQGYTIPLFARPQDCTACTSCSKMCPDCAITVYK